MIKDLMLNGNLMAAYFPSDAVKGDYGFFHVYAFTMTIGMIVSILACYFKMRAKHIPIEPLIWSIFFIIPAALFGGSFFGKINGEGIGTNAEGMTWYQCFEFWKAGMSIHGGVLFGIVVGIIFFSCVSHHYQVSLFAFGDAIIPNILLGQVIGRWGNFFNHELLGDPVTYQSLEWLPQFIRDNCWKLVNGAPETLQNGDILYRAPIFLYESFGNFFAWVIITFALPHAGRLFQKDVYRKYNYSLNARVKYFFNRKAFAKEPISYASLWKKEYYGVKPTLKDSLAVEKKYKEYNDDSQWWQRMFGSKESRDLTKLNNPNGSWITHSGVEMGIYFFLWNFVRFFIEIQRSQGSDWFIMNDLVADYVVIWAIALIGLALALIAQFISPYRFRACGFQYEKEYSDMHNPNNWNFDCLAKEKIVVGKNNSWKDFLPIVKSHVVNITGIVNFDEYFTCDWKDFAGETLHFDFKIVPNNAAKSDLGITDRTVVSMDYRVNMTKLFKNTFIDIIFSKTKFQKLSENELYSLIDRLLDQKSLKKTIKERLLTTFNDVDDQKSAVFSAKAAELLSLNPVTINAGQTSFFISKFSIKESHLFFCKKGFKLKLTKPDKL